MVFIGGEDDFLRMMEGEIHAGKRGGHGRLMADPDRPHRHRIGQGFKYLRTHAADSLEAIGEGDGGGFSLRRRAPGHEDRQGRAVGGDQRQGGAAGEDFELPGGLSESRGVPGLGRDRGEKRPHGDSRGKEAFRQALEEVIGHCCREFPFKPIGTRPAEGPESEGVRGGLGVMIPVGKVSGETFYVGELVAALRQIE